MKNKITIKHKNADNQPKQFSLMTPAFRALFPDLQGGIKGYFFSFLQDVLKIYSPEKYDKMDKDFAKRGTSIWEIFEKKIGLRFIDWELERAQMGVNSLLSFEKEVLR